MPTLAYPDNLTAIKSTRKGTSEPLPEKGRPINAQVGQQTPYPRGFGEFQGSVPELGVPAAHTIMPKQLPPTIGIKSTRTYVAEPVPTPWTFAGAKASTTASTAPDGSMIRTPAYYINLAKIMSENPAISDYDRKRFQLMSAVLTQFEMLRSFQKLSEADEITKRGYEMELEAELRRAPAIALPPPRVGPPVAQPFVSMNDLYDELKLGRATAAQSALDLGADLSSGMGAGFTTLSSNMAASTSGQTRSLMVFGSSMNANTQKTLNDMLAELKTMPASIITQAEAKGLLAVAAATPGVIMTPGGITASPSGATVAPSTPPATPLPPSPSSGGTIAPAPPPAIIPLPPVAGAKTVDDLIAEALAAGAVSLKMIPITSLKDLEGRVSTGEVKRASPPPLPEGAFDTSSKAYVDDMKDINNAATVLGFVLASGDLDAMNTRDKAALTNEAVKYIEVNRGMFGDAIAHIMDNKFELAKFKSLKDAYGTDYSDEAFDEFMKFIKLGGISDMNETAKKLLYVGGMATLNERHDAYLVNKAKSIKLMRGVGAAEKLRKIDVERKEIASDMKSMLLNIISGIGSENKGEGEDYEVEGVENEEIQNVLAQVNIEGSEEKEASGALVGSSTSQEQSTPSGSEAQTQEEVPPTEVKMTFGTPQVEQNAGIAVPGTEMKVLAEPAEEEYVEDDPELKEYNAIIESVKDPAVKAIMKKGFIKHADVKGLTTTQKGVINKILVDIYVKTKPKKGFRFKGKASNAPIITSKHKQGTTIANMWERLGLLPQKNIFNIEELRIEEPT